MLSCRTGNVAINVLADKLSSRLPKLAIVAESELRVLLVVICSLMCFLTSGAMASISRIVRVTCVSIVCSATFLMVVMFTGNPGVFPRYPYPYPPNPHPQRWVRVLAGKGLAGLAGFKTLTGLQYPWQL